MGVERHAGNRRYHVCGDFSGRDIKNLLKLAMLSHGGDYITREIIDQVKVYKPTTQAGTL